MSPSSSSDEDDRLSARSPSSVPRLRGAANYTTWKATLSAVLLGRGLLSLVTSSTKPLPASDDRLKWERRNEKAYAAIFLSLDPVVTASLPADLAPYDAAALWAQLSTSYASSNGARKAALLGLLVNTKLAEGADPLKHLAFLLATYKDLIATGLALDDHSFALIALHSLPGSYQPVTGSLFHQTSVSSTDVFSAIQAEVQRRAGIGAAGRNKTTSTALATTSAPRNTRDKDRLQNDPNAYCEEHQAHGHATENCFVRFRKDAAARVASRSSGPRTASVAVATAASSEPEIASAFVATASAYIAVGQRDAASFWLDSCASDHMVFDRRLLDDLSPSSGAVQVGDNRSISITHTGSVQLVGASGKTIRLKNVLLVPDLGRNLVSVGRLEAAGFALKFGNGRVTVHPSPTAPASIDGARKDFIYVLHVVRPASFGAPRSATASAALATSSEALRSWHHRLGHLNVRDVAKMAADGAIPGVSFSRADVDDFFCNACHLGKA